MADIRITTPAPFGGVSRQPPELRHLNQVQDAQDTLFSVVDGFSKRPGSELLTAIDNKFPNLTDAAWIESTKTITQTGAFTNYTFDAADRIFISGGSSIVPGTYQIASRVDDDSITLSTSISRAGGPLLFGSGITSGLAADQAYRTHMIERDETEQYMVIYGSDTLRIFDVLSGAEAIVQWDNRSNDTTRKIRVTNGTWTAATKTLSETNAFANYFAGFATNDVIYISGGSGDTVPGIYQIASAPDAHTITLTKEISASDETGVTSGAPATDYYGGTGPDDIEMVSVADYTLITNRTVTPTTRTTSDYTKAGDKTDYSSLVDGPTSDGEIWKVTNTTGNDEGRPIGFYYVDKGTNIVDDNGFILEPDQNSFVRIWKKNQTDAILNATTSPISLVRTATNPLTFTVNLTPWHWREAGDDFANPAPPPWKDGLPIQDMTFHRNRLVIAADETNTFTQSGDVFNPWINDDLNIVDSDPINAPLTSDQVTLANHLVPFQKSILMFTKASRQFQFTADILKPGNGDFLPTTSYDTIRTVRPAVLGHKLYLATSDQNSGKVLEYAFSDAEATNLAGDVTKHIEGYIPSNMKSINASSNSNAVVVNNTDSSSFYVYRAHWTGTEKVQSAWSTYTQPESERIVDIGIIEENMYLLNEIANGYIIDRMPIVRELPAVSTGTWYGAVIEGLVHTDYTGISDGEFTVSIDGVEADVTGLDFTSDVSIANIAATIQTGIQAAFAGSPLCRVQGERFVITSATTGVNSTVSVVTAVDGGVGTDIATEALLGAPGVAYSPTMPYSPRIDRRTEITGTYNSGTNETTWDYGFDDPCITELILGRDFGPLSGGRLAVTRVNDSSVKVTGDFSQGEAILGRPYTSSVTLSKPIMRSRDGNSILEGRLQLRRLNVNHNDTGAYRIRISNAQRPDRDVEIENVPVGVDDVVANPTATGSLKARIMGNADNTTVHIQNDTPLPHTISSFEYLAEFTPVRSSG